MNQKENKREKAFNIDPVLKVFHVGGRGGFGPIHALLQMSSDLSITLFEADIEDHTEYDSLPADYKRDWGISLSVM